MSINQYQHPRDQIVDIMKRIYGYGMTTTSGGNLSILDSNGDMWISPGSVDKGTLQRDDIVCVKADGSVEGRHKPSSEFPFHRAIYKMRPDIKAILHAHPPALVSFSIAGIIPDTAVLPTARQVCGEVGFAPYAVPGSEQLGRNIAEVFAKGHYTILLENHGAVTAGDTLLKAFQRFETLDFCARLINKATQIGQPQYLTDAQIDFGLMSRNAGFKEFERDEPTSGEKELRLKMCELIQRAYRQMLFTSTEGTFSVRIDANSFLITPYGIDRGSLTPADLVLVQGNKYEKGKPLSRAAWFFKAIYDAQPELNSLIIANPPNVMAYGVANVHFDPRLIPESYILLREIPTLEFGEHFLDVSHVTGVLSPRTPVVLIKNDCLVSAGRTLLEAYDRMEVAEYSAKAAISARLLGGMHPINGQQVDELVTAFKLIK